MRNFWGLSRILCIGLSLVLFGCASAEELKTTVSMAGFPDPDDNILLIVGEGGPSGGLFIKAAETYRREHGGVIYPVDGGDSFVDAMEDFVAKYGAIDHLEYFGHGNSVGLYVNQAPNVNGGLYANDPQLDENYLAASIYQLPADIFSARGDIRFNGCNVAEGFPELPTLAQSFANYFGVKVEAPRGPTEFSKTPDLVDPIPDSKYLGSDFAGPVYMVSTYVDKSFVEVFPQRRVGKFLDVREGQSFQEGVYGLVDAGLNLEFKEGPDRFLPYQVITYGEAAEFCRVATGKDCGFFGHEPDERVRNLRALQMLVDNSGVSLKPSSPWYDSYIYWANNQNLLTKDFVTKKWYTRGEMAELSWNFHLYN